MQFLFGNSQIQKQPLLLLIGRIYDRDGNLIKNSKTTFVTVNHGEQEMAVSGRANSKTTFVTVNRVRFSYRSWCWYRFKNNLCYC